MNLYLNDQSKLENVMELIAVNLKIHGKVMLYWKGEELGVVTKPKDTIFINNCKTSNTEPGFIPGEGAMTPLRRSKNLT